MRKGFTIVELVIVIAVIAILAGVLIPTFGGVIDKANQSRLIQQKDARDNYYVINVYVGVSQYPSHIETDKIEEKKDLIESGYIRYDNGKDSDSAESAQIWNRTGLIPLDSTQCLDLVFDGKLELNSDPTKSDFLVFLRKADGGNLLTVSSTDLEHGVIVDRVYENGKTYIRVYFSEKVNENMRGVKFCYKKVNIACTPEVYILN